MPKAWPGLVAQPGDNVPWNMFGLKSLGFGLADNNSYPVTPTAAQLLALRSEDNSSTVLVRPTSGSNINRFRAKSDLTKVYFSYGANILFSKAFSNPVSEISATEDYVMHRVHLLAGLAGHNQTGNPQNFSLTAIAALIDNQPDGAAASTLTTTAKTFATSETGLLEVGVQVGDQANGVHYPGVVEALGVVVDQASNFVNLDVYKSMDGNIWFPVEKAGYNSNGWVNGEYLVDPWREDEVGAATEKGRIIAFNRPQLANYFKVVFNNSGGQQFDINEVYAFNYQGKIGFSSDLTNYRQAIASKIGNLYLYNLADLSVIYIGAGPIGPSGNYAILDPDTGIWEDPSINAWYDPTIQAWINQNGQVWDTVNSVWVDVFSAEQVTSGTPVSIPGLSAASNSLLNTILEENETIDIADSEVKLPVVREFLFEFLPFHPMEDTASHNSDLELQEFRIFNFPAYLNTANNQGVFQTYINIPARAGMEGDVITERIYNNHPDKKAIGLEVWLDAQGVFAEELTTTDPRLDGNGDVISMIIPSGWSANEQLEDKLRSISAVRNILDADLDGIGVLGDSSVEMVNRHKVDDAANNITTADASVTGSPYNSLDALCTELKADYNAHIPDTTYHDTADTANANSDTWTGATDLAGMITFLNNLKAQYLAHLIQDDGTANHVHGLKDVWYDVLPANATDEATAVALANAIKDQYNKHLVGGVYTEVGGLPTPGEFSIDYALGQITFGATTADGVGIKFHYMSEGSSTIKLSQGGSSWTDAPNHLVFSGVSVLPGQYTELKLKSDLTGYSDERDRPTILLGEWSY